MVRSCRWPWPPLRSSRTFLSSATVAFIALRLSDSNPFPCAISWHESHDDDDDDDADAQKPDLTLAAQTLSKLNFMLMDQVLVQ